MLRTYDVHQLRLRRRGEPQLINDSGQSIAHAESANAVTDPVRRKCVYRRIFKQNLEGLPVPTTLFT